MNDKETCQPRTTRETLPQLPQHGLQQFEKPIGYKLSEKRATDKKVTTSETIQKRISMEGDVPETVPNEAMTLSFMRKNKKSLEKMTRSEMEELISLKMVEALHHKSELADLKAKCDAQENIISSLRTKSYELSKQFHELEILHSQTINDMALKNKDYVTPVKVQRAVGVQVCLPRRYVSADITSAKAASDYAAHSNATHQSVAKKHGSNWTTILKPNTDGTVAQRRSARLHQTLQNQQQTFQNQANSAKAVQPEQLPLTAFIDLTDDDDLMHSPSIAVCSPPVAISGQSKAKFLAKKSRIAVTKIGNQVAQEKETAPLQVYHPAPLPFPDNHASCWSWGQIPPPPNIHVKTCESGIVLSWTMNDMNEDHADIMSYQIYAYQETSAVPSTDKWFSVGEVEAMMLPMAVTLSNCPAGQRYHFAIRAIDEHARYGLFSISMTWS